MQFSCLENFWCLTHISTKTQGHPYKLRFYYRYDTAILLAVSPSISPVPPSGHTAVKEGEEAILQCQVGATNVLYCLVLYCIILHYHVLKYQSSLLWWVLFSNTIWYQIWQTNPSHVHLLTIAIDDKF